MRAGVIIAVLVVAFGGLVLMSKKDDAPAASKSAPASSQTAKTAAKPQAFSEIQSALANGSQLIDVRTADEYAASHIDGAINLSLQDMQAGATPTVAKDKTVYVYCHSGNRSGQATKILQQAGYTVVDMGAMTNVQNIGGNVKQS